MMNEEDSLASLVVHLLEEYDIEIAVSQAKEIAASIMDHGFTNPQLYRNPVTGINSQAEARLNSTQRVLRERERELRALKGPCSSDECLLYYAHSGPCWITMKGV